MGNNFSGETSVPEYSVPPEVKYIQKGALNGCRIDTLIIPETVQFLGNECLSGWISDTHNVYLKGVYKQSRGTYCELQTNKQRFIGGSWDKLNDTDYSHRIEEYRLDNFGNLDTEFDLMYSQELSDYLRDNLVITYKTIDGTETILDNKKVLVFDECKMIDDNTVLVTFEHNGKKQSVIPGYWNGPKLRKTGIESFDYELDTVNNTVKIKRLKRGLLNLALSEKFTIDGIEYTSDYSNFYTIPDGQTETSTKYIRLPFNSVPRIDDEMWRDKEGDGVLICTNPRHFEIYAIGEYWTSYSHSDEYVEDTKDLEISPYYNLKNKSISYVGSTNLNVNKSYKQMNIVLENFPFNPEYDGNRQHIDMFIYGKLGLYGIKNPISFGFVNDNTRKFNSDIYLIGYSESDFENAGDDIKKQIDNIKTYSDCKLHFYPDVESDGTEVIEDVEDKFNVKGIVGDTLQINNVLSTDEKLIIKNKYKYNETIYDKIAFIDKQDYNMGNFTYTSPFYGKSFTEIYFQKGIDLTGIGFNYSMGGKALFSECRNVKIIDLRNCKFKDNITDYSDTFRNCENLEKILGVEKALNSKKVIYLSSMYSGCKKLTYIDNTFETDVSSQYINIREFARNCENLGKYSQTNLTNLKGKVANASSAFLGCKSMTNLNISNLDFSNIDDLNLFGMFVDTISLKILSLLNPKSKDKILNSNTGLSTDVTIFTKPEDVSENWEYTVDTETNTVNLTKYIGTDTDIVVRNQYIVEGTQYNNVVLSKSVMPLSDDENLTDEEKSEIESQRSPFFSVRSTTTSLRFEQGVKLEENANFYFRGAGYTIDFNGLDTSSVTSMYGFLQEYSGTKLDISYLDTTNVKQFGYMFFDCKSTEIKGLENLKTNEQFTTGMMFRLSKIEIADLSGLNFLNCTSGQGMFLDSNIKTLYVSSEENKTKINTLDVRLPSSSTIIVKPQLMSMDETLDDEIKPVVKSTRKKKT